MTEPERVSDNGLTAIFCAAGFIIAIVIWIAGRLAKGG